MNTATRPLQGFRPFFAKELFEWWKGRGALTTAVVLCALGTLGTMAGRIDALAGGASTPEELNPTYNILGAQFQQWIVFASIFASLGLLIRERDSGTLAWTVSKPVSRSSVLLAKWLAATAMLTVFGLFVPLAFCSVIATLAYGDVPDVAAVATMGAWLAAIPAFMVALSLALSTRLQSAGAIAAIGFSVALAPYLFQAFLPVLAMLWPTSMAAMATQVAAGEAVSMATVVSWAASLVVIGSTGLVVFSREDL